MARTRRVRTRPVLQMEAAECGAAALAVVLAYHRIHVPLERLREECGVSRDGTNAARLIRVARGYGLEGAGYVREPEQLAALPMPAILHWSFDHFVVLEGIGRSAAWLNDPERGRVKVARSEVDRLFTGPVFVFRRGPNWRPVGSPPSLLAAVWEWLSGSRRAVLFLALLGLFLVLPGLAVPALGRIFVDELLTERHTELLVPLLAGIALTAVSRALLTWLQRDALARISCRLVVGLATRYVWRALRLPFSFYVARHPADLAARVEIGDRLSWLLSGELPAVGIAAAMVLFFWALMLWMSPTLAVVALLFAAAAIATDRLGASARADRAIAATSEQARLASVTAGGLQMIETLKANGTDSHFFARWAASHGRAMDAERALALWSEGLSAAGRLVHTCGELAVLGLGGLQVADGTMTLGTLVAFQSLTASFLGPLGELVTFAGRLDEIKAEVARWNDVIGQPEDSPRELVVEGRPAERGDVERPRDRPNPSRDALAVASGASQPTIDGALELRGLSAGYDGGGPVVVNGINLRVSPGGRVAIVGRTGSGKSTIARVVCGLIEPHAGEVLFDGRRRESLPRDALAMQVALVEQDVQLFEATVAENLSLWDPTIGREALERAVHDACLDEVVALLPGGLDARIVEAGANLSGGERQRMALARALARDPVLLVLDEATSALDAETERRVYEHLRRRGCTCLVVAHRLSAIRDCDEIVVLEEGRVVERGSHEALMRRGGIYASLVSSA